MNKKKYGQNFLISETLAKKIIEILNIKQQNIIEIGPGNLALTKYIIEKKPKKFIAIDIDKEIIDKHKKNSQKFSKYLLNYDAIKFDEFNFFNKEPFLIISNLPFNISSKLLIKWTNMHNELNCINGMVLMFQKELGERIISTENKKKYGRLSILAQSTFNITKEIHVKKGNFKPAPKVDAVVLKFTPLKKKNKFNFNNLEKITNFFFNSRRKKVEKKIKKIFNKKQITDNNFEKIYNLRAENISKEIYYKMSTLL